MAFLLKILAHVEIATSSVNVIYSPASGSQAIVTDVIISNLGTVTANLVSFCVTSNGLANVSASAIIWNKVLDTANQGVLKLVQFNETHGINLTNAGSIGAGGTANFLVLGLENIL